MVAVNVLREGMAPDINKRNAVGQCKNNAVGRAKNNAGTKRHEVARRESIVASFCRMYNNKDNGFFQVSFQQKGLVAFFLGIMTMW